MKTTIVRSTKNFQPIDVTISIQSVEELKQFLLLTAAMCHPGAYDKNTLMDRGFTLLYDEKQNSHASAGDLADFVSAMVDHDQWDELQQVYNEFAGE